MIRPTDLVSKFKYALDNDFGYIYGKAGELWTEADQKSATREQTKLYGAKWIGHRVADCSGLFYWAFRQLGGKIYHGSNTMFREYCSEVGELKKGQRTDGKELKAGTAVFTGTKEDHGHVGLYIGDGWVIEAKSTQAGVVKSRITDKKWTWWGELKGVDYGDASVEPAKPEPGANLPTIRRGDKGEYVTLAQVELKKRGYDLGPCGVDGDFGKATEAAVKRFQQDWGLKQDGIVGPQTWKYLQTSVPRETLYTVTIQHVNQEQAGRLKNEFPGCSVTEE